ncbi:hypothetical protein WAB17_12485 [Parerythrobacter aurantius]|uniref:hypothetical protein n=1 Tax=Parerythrobacter aurantius TaxID=3127706 RepID=UPI00324921F1
MTRLEEQLRADRQLRDQARSLVEADLDRVRSEWNARPLGSRAFDRIKDGAAELIETAHTKTEGKAGVAALLFGAVALWFASNPIRERFSRDGQDEPTPPPSPESDGDAT